MRLLILNIVFVLFAYACKQKTAEKMQTIEKWNIDFETPAIITKKSLEPYEGKYYTYADSINKFTYGISYPIPDSIKGFIRVCVDFYARIKRERYGQSLIVSVSRKDVMLIWHPFSINNYTFRKDKWVHIVDSMQFLKRPDTNGSELKIFGFHSYKEGELNIDNLKVVIKNLQPL